MGARKPHVVTRGQHGRQQRFHPFCKIAAGKDHRIDGDDQLAGAWRSTFDITERFKFIFGADCQNLTNKVTFSGINASINSSNFGTVSGATGNNASRDFQFSGRLNF